MISPKGCPNCFAKSLERQNEVVYLQTVPHLVIKTPPTMRLKPWVCGNCDMVTFFKMQEPKP